MNGKHEFRVFDSKEDAFQYARPFCVDPNCEVFIWEM